MERRSVRYAVNCVDAACGLLHVVLAAVSATLVCASVLAQTLPAEKFVTQETLRQQERERAVREQQERIPDVHLQPPGATDAMARLPSDDMPCFVIDRITLSGKAANRFQWALAAADRTSDGKDDSPLHRCLGSRGINQVMKRIQNAIVADGYITTRVLAEPQDLTGGLLNLTLIPGHIHRIRFAPGTDLRATQWNAMPARAGDLLHLRDIEQALENFKRVPTAEADIQIAPAENGNNQPAVQPGESDLVIQWKQGIPFRLNLSADDSGTKATGKYQDGVTLSFDNWWTLNDLFYVSINRDMGGSIPGARGTGGVVVHYSLPFGYWLLGATVSRNHYYQSIAGATQTYIYSGNNENSEIRLSRLIYRDAVRKTTVSLRGWRRTSNNFIDDTEVEVQRRRVAGWDLGIAHREFIDGAAVDLGVNYRRATGAFDALPAPEEAFGEGASRPGIINAEAQLNLPFALGRQRLRYSAAWRAQWNRTPLVPQDRFAIGSRYTVRGFDGEGQLVADRGWLARNDLGVVLGQSGQELYAGIDTGAVGGPSSNTLVGTHLAGAVVGLRGGVNGWTYDFFLGLPIARPDGFQTAAMVAGFNLNRSY